MNKDLLRVQYLPDKDRIIGRDEELTQLANVIKDAAHGRTPNNVLVYGKTGTGKSLCTRYITNDLVSSAEKNDVSVGVAYVDCFQDSTETQTVRSIADSLNDPEQADVKIPMSGLSTSDYYRRRGGPSRSSGEVRDLEDEINALLRYLKTHGEVDDDRLRKWDAFQELAADYDVPLPQRDQYSDPSTSKTSFTESRTGCLNPLRSICRESCHRSWWLVGLNLLRANAEESRHGISGPAL